MREEPKNTRQHALGTNRLVQSQEHVLQVINPRSERSRSSFHLFFSPPGKNNILCGSKIGAQNGTWKLETWTKTCGPLVP